MAIVEVVKYNGTPDILAWKYPNEELGTWTQLIVNQSQEAVLVKGGRVLAVFGPGKHTLNTANIPLLKNIIALPFGGRSPFTAEIWYINKTCKLDIRWGTPTPVQLQDPKYGIFVPVRANGMFGIQVSDAWLFMTKLVGTLPSFDAASVQRYFRGVCITKVKDAIADYAANKGISVLEINAHIDELSQHLKESIQPEMAEFGIVLVGFYVNDISVPEEDPGVKQLKAALAKRAEMGVVGYSYQQERSFDVLESAAKNGGSSAPFTGAGIGLAMGQAVGAEVGKLVQGLNISSQRCPTCGAPVAVNAKFCSECGKALPKCCPKCSTALEGNPKFCPECGERL